MVYVPWETSKWLWWLVEYLTLFNWNLRNLIYKTASMRQRLRPWRLDKMETKTALSKYLLRFITYKSGILSLVCFLFVKLWTTSQILLGWMSWERREFSIPSGKWTNVVLENATQLIYFVHRSGKSHNIMSWSFNDNIEISKYQTNLFDT